MLTYIQHKGGCVGVSLPDEEDEITNDITDQIKHLSIKRKYN